MYYLDKGGNWKINAEAGASNKDSYKFWYAWYLVIQVIKRGIFDCGVDILPSRPLCIAISTSPVHQNQLKQHDQVKHLHSDKSRMA